jgi:hypothetical protein
MGLDMYLTKKNYIGAKFEHNHITGKIELFQDGKPININLNRVTYIIEEIGYWCKANAIHGWFVENVQDGNNDCNEYYVSDEQIQELLNIVNKILENNSLAEELLSTQTGFFFGETDYDEYYFEELENTRKILENALKEEDGEIYYQASW